MDFRVILYMNGNLSPARIKGKFHVIFETLIRCDKLVHFSDKILNGTIMTRWDDQYSSYGKFFITK